MLFPPAVRRRRAGATGALLVAALFLGPLTAAAAEAPLRLVARLDEALADWALSGSNTFRYDYYHREGDTAASPYAFPGSKIFDEVNLTATKRGSPFDVWRLQFSGVLNDSEYRNSKTGVIPERLALLREKGDGALPHRLEAGDLFAFFSLRTLQQSLKGVQLEFQPQLADPDHRQSLLLLAGTPLPTWRDLDPGDDFGGGLSWLVEHARWGRASLNLVGNFRRARPDTGALERQQAVVSLAADKTWRHPAGETTLEAELASFFGDHDGRVAAADGQGTHELGLFTQVSGRGPEGLTYRGRYEWYGADYRPRGAVVAPDRRSLEGHLGWRFQPGPELRGRAQHFRDGLNAANPTDTRTLGLSAAGALLPGLLPTLSGSLDAFDQEVKDQAGTRDTTTQVVSLNVSHPIALGILGRLGGSWQRADSRLPGVQDTTTAQVTAALDLPVRALGITGTITPGMLYREVRVRGDGTTDYGPTLALALTRGPHSLSVNWTWAVQERRPETAVDVATATTGVLYRYVQGPHSLGLEFNADNRDPKPGRSTDSYRLGAFYTFALEKPGRPAAAPGAARPPAPERVELHDLTPGAALEAVQARLARARIGGPSELPGLIVYEAQLLPEIPERQRLVLAHAEGKLEQAALIITLDDPGTPAVVMERFERIRRALLDRLGGPSQFFDRGQVTANLVSDIHTGAFIRLTEWARPGGTIRLGIPRRLDRQVRIEVHFAPGFPPPGETLWSIEQVR